MELLERFRYFLKDTVRQTIDFRMTDQNRGVPPPPAAKPFSEDAERITLPAPDSWQNIPPADLVTAIRNRKSHRHFTADPIDLEELSFLLWATQGIRGKASGSSVFRTVPSAGCRHALETYLYVNRITSLDRGIYRFLPLQHQLLVVFRDEHLSDRITSATLGQAFTGNAAVTFIWTTIPYRMEWRYHTAAHKVIAIDAGHVCQNLYLAGSVIGGGVCAVGAYHQEMMDSLLRVDGKDEFTIYLAAVGKL